MVHKIPPKNNFLTNADIFWVSTKRKIAPNLEWKFLVRPEISENLDTPRQVALVLANSLKCCSIRKLKFPEIETRIFLQMESVIGISFARAFFIFYFFLITF